MFRCRKLLESGSYEAIYIHGLGNAVDRAINIALQLTLSSSVSEDSAASAIFLSANTSTVDVIDDFEPLCDDNEPASRMRQSSAIHIKLVRGNPKDLAKNSNGAERVRITNSALKSEMCACEGNLSSGSSNRTVVHDSS